jgi:hypothetical protein
MYQTFISLFLCGIQSCKGTSFCTATALTTGFNSWKITFFTVTITSVGNQILIRYTFVVKFSKIPANLQVSVRFQYGSTVNFLIPGTDK